MVQQFFPGGKPGAKKGECTLSFDCLHPPSAIISSATDECDDLDPIAVAKNMRGVFGSRNEIPIDFDGEMSAWQVKAIQQLRKGDSLGSVD